MFLLDTNVISEMRKVKKGNAHPVFTQWLARSNPEHFYTNVIVLMELERGVLGMERKDAEQGKVLRAWFSETIPALFGERILPITPEIAHRCAALHIPNKSPENDAWIAATALQHGLTLATRNGQDFAHTGVAWFNPFMAATK